jgi:hypothetical protein
VRAVVIVDVEHDQGDLGLGGPLKGVDTGVFL